LAIKLAIGGVRPRTPEASGWTTVRRQTACGCSVWRVSSSDKGQAVSWPASRRPCRRSGR